MPALDAQALALGRVTVQSSLGEPLRAEIDLPEITADEVATLRASLGSAQSFRSQGIEMNPALADVSITLQKTSDGRYFLRLVGTRPVNEPFVDVVLETTWASGRIRRDFTMLFDPPALRQGDTSVAQATPIAPSAGAQPTATARATPAQRGQRATTPAQRSATPAAPAGDGKQVTVQAGDTAARLAGASKPASISLDQMLVAMLRSNPDAFVGGNVNRLRAGAVLNMPSQEQAALVEQSEARQTLVAQSRDFNEFRRKLAEAVPAAPATKADREARGRLQAQVEDKKPAASAPDKLTLSKGAVQPKGGEDKIARDRAAQDQATRMAELNRNLTELRGLSGAASAPRSAAAAAPAAATNASRPLTPAVPLGAPPAVAAASAAKPASMPAPAIAAAASAPLVKAAASAPVASGAAASAPVVAAAASAPAATTTTAAASAPSTASPAPVAAAPADAASATPAVATARPASAARKPAPPPPPPPSLLDELRSEPYILAAIGGVVALLLGLGFWKWRQRRQATQVDSSFLESRLQPDSFFGASGGQRVDTNEGAATGSSMVYSPSQLDAAGDVDPVAEADVYLAYGRDLQAEEILKEAVRVSPQRTAIHVKLLEIYAKRRDVKAFEQVAGQAQSLTHGEGSDWARICELGQGLDPANPMYKAGGQAVVAGTAPVVPAAAPIPVASNPFLATTKQAAAAEPAPAAAAGVDFDLDLDFSLGDEPAAPAPAAAGMVDPDATFLPGSMAMAPERTQPIVPVEAPVMDFGSTQATQPARLDAPDLTVSSDDGLSFDLSPPAAAPAPVAAAPAAVPDSGMIEFDMGSLSLDLDPPAAAAPAAAEPSASLDMPALDMPAAAGADDPLATKLALAEEFNAIGDADGARSLAQEVVAEASGDLRTKAQKFLAEIS